MNENVAPHRLVSISAFEEDHPNAKTQLFNVMVVQRGQDNGPNRPAEPITGGIFHTVVL
jgi:hypothetical protein